MFPKPLRGEATIQQSSCWSGCDGGALSTDDVVEVRSRSAALRRLSGRVSVLLVWSLWVCGYDRWGQVVGVMTLVGLLVR